MTNFTRPTLQELVDRAKGDIKSALGITTVLRRSFIQAISRALGGLAHTLHGHIIYASRQLFPDQADDEYLKRWGSIYGLEPNAATFTQLTITGTGTNGSVLSDGDQFQTPGNFVYEVDADVTVAGGVYTAQVTAVVAGDEGNLADGETISLVSAVAGIDADALISATVTEGEDTETDDAFRIRLIERIQEPPAGGKATDYVAYAKSVTGVTRAWVHPGNRGSGTVDVSFVEDSDDPIIPDAAKVAEVQAVVDVEKPVTADSIVFAPTANEVDMTINLKPNTVSVRAAVTAELGDLFARENEVAGAYKSVDEVYTGEIPLSKINEAISIADGEDDHELLSPIINPVPGQGGILVLGTLTFGTLA